MSVVQAGLRTLDGAPLHNRPRARWHEAGSCRRGDADEDDYVDEWQAHAALPGHGCQSSEVAEGSLSGKFADEKREGAAGGRATSPYPRTRAWAWRDEVALRGLRLEAAERCR